MAYKLEQNED